MIYTSGSTGVPRVHGSAGAASPTSCCRCRGTGTDWATDVLAVVTTLVRHRGCSNCACLSWWARSEIELVPKTTTSKWCRPGCGFSTRPGDGHANDAVHVAVATESDWHPPAGFRSLVRRRTAPAIEVAERLLDKVTELWNLYGPTETTIRSTR